MSRSKSIYTTHLRSGAEDKNFKYTDISHESGTALYVRVLAKCTSEYAFALKDALSNSHLADVITETGPAAKKKTINLYQPESQVELEYTGTISFEWSARFEGHHLQWHKGLLGSIYCSLMRKPDPSIEIAKFTPRSRKSPATFTILDYNIARMDIDDIRGLEIVLLCSIFTFIDISNDDVVSITPNTTPPTPTNQTPSSNTLSITPDFDFEAQVRNTMAMLDQNSFITLHAPESAAVQTAIRVAESAKRRYMKRSGGLRNDDDLYLYVIADDLGNKYTRTSKIYIPPSSLTIHISKSHMAQFEARQQQKGDVAESVDESAIEKAIESSGADAVVSDTVSDTVADTPHHPSQDLDQGPPPLSKSTYSTPTNSRTSFINSLNKLRRGVAKV